MRILVMSDIHANLSALEAVLNDAGLVDAVWCLGDLVGYGPNPNECVQRIQELPNLVCVQGNHDAAALGKIDTEAFNNEAGQALRWTKTTLSTSSLAFLDSLPEKQVVDLVTLTHGSPRRPIWEYILDTYTAALNLLALETPYGFVGHSHHPVVFMVNGEDAVTYELPEADQVVEMPPLAIFNPGSVGQPRDHDPRAAYAIYEPEIRRWTQRRIAYDIVETQNRIRAAELPLRFAVRLVEGS
ncbi:MAG: metallophosphoesterase family protein [Longilinea sp.]|nr:metallophosphoesterase family protein [Longilinea sp.]